MTRNQRNFKALQKVVDLEAVQRCAFDCGRSRVPGYMDLHFDYLYGNDVAAVVALSHYYRQNGDSIADPDMELRISFAKGTVEALAFQDSFVPCLSG